MGKRPFPDELMFLKNRKAVQKITDAPMTGKVVVITGSTSGVGYEAAKRLAQGGAHLVLVARNIDKAEKVKAELQALHPVSVELVIADFADLDDVRKAAAAILSDYPRIDVLINCAGMHSTTRILTKEGFETVFCVNHLASFLFTELLLERVKASAPARILQINSEGHRFNGLDLEDLDWHRRRYKGLKGYGASKTAQLLTVWELHDQLQGSGVTINAMHPGDVKTGIGSNNGPLYRFFFKHFTSHFLKDPVISGEAIYYLSAAPELTDVSGRFFHLTIDEKPAKHALDRAIGARVYAESRRLVGLSSD
ncbi:MAG: SDR family NAD(P)-dependent oxidoreductase [Bacillota bacterium]|nr:SDR family NAD(P)-dependent oxidoreductase [Bacillota bacterium]